MVLHDLLDDVLGRIEDPVPTFWSLTGEVYPQMVDALFEAALITGVVQLSNVQVTLAPETTYFSLQPGATLGYGEGGFGEGGYGGGIGIPEGVIAMLRMRAPYAIRKTTLKALDDMIPSWQQADPVSQIIAWFPLGVSYFGIYPQLAAETQVVMDFLVSPVNQSTPYDGNEPIPLQDEFACLLSKYAAAMLRSKEGGAEAEEADIVFQSYLSEVKDLSAFQTRIDSLVYSAAFGAQSAVNPRKVV